MFDKPDLMLNYVIVDEGVPLISEGIVLEINRKFHGEPVCFMGTEGYIPFSFGKMLGERPGISGMDELWRRFYALLPDIPALPGGRTACVTYRGDAPDGFTSSFVGAETRVCEEDPRFVKWILPAREYVVCGFEAEDFLQLAPVALGKAMKYTRFWLREHGLIADGFFPEIYYPGIAYMEIRIPFRQRI